MSIISGKCLVKINGCKHPVSGTHRDIDGDGLQQGQLWYTSCYQIRSSHMNSVQRKTYHVFMYSQDCLKSLQYNWVLCHPKNHSHQPGSTSSYVLLLWQTMTGMPCPLGQGYHYYQTDCQRNTLYSLYIDGFLTLNQLDRLYFGWIRLKFSLNKIIWANDAKTPLYYIPWTTDWLMVRCFPAFIIIPMQPGSDIIPSPKKQPIRGHRTLRPWGRFLEGRFF